jgi:tetratricopeptide (TPR) repeat protein
MPTEHYKEAIKLYNPQNASNPTIKATFVIRLKEFDKIWKDIKNSKMSHPEQHYIIQGIRGSGKSTLLTRLSIEIEEDPDLSTWLIPILFREEEYGITSLFTFWERIAEELCEHPLYADQFDGLLDKIENFEDDPKAAFKLLDSYLVKANKKLILFIDNLAELFETYSRNEEEMLREVLSQNNNIRIVGGSAISLENFYDNKAPFYQFFHIITLKEINQQETITLLINLGKYLGKEEEAKIKQLIEEEPEKIETIRRLTGGIPRTLILLFQILIEGPRGTAFQYLEDTLDKVSPIYKHRMDDLSKQQKPIIHAIAKNWEAMSAKEIAQQTRMDSKQVSAQLNQLQKQWLIEKIPTSTKNHLYALQERFFNIWYLMRYGRRKDRNKLIWLTRFFEVWCSKDELVERATSFHKELSQASSPRGAMIYASALINSNKLEFKEREQVYNKTRLHLEQNGHGNLARELPNLSGDDYLQQGVESMESGKFKEAETYLRKAIKAGNKLAYLILGNLFLDLKQYEKAEENYRLAIEHTDTAYYNLGVLFAELQQYEKAEVNFRLAIEHEDTKAYNNLGVLFAELKQYEKAETNFRLAIESGNTRAYFNLGIMFDELKQYEEAEANYRLAIENGYTKAYFYLGYLFRELKQYEEAEDNFRLAIKHGDTKAYNNLGIIFAELEQYEEAEEDFQLAIKHGDTDAYFNLGIMFDELKQYEKAEANYRLAIEHGDTDAYFNLGNLFRELKQYEQAEANYRLAIEHGDTDAYFNLGNLFKELRQYEQAEANYRLAIEHGDTDVYFNLGNLFSELKQYEKAENIYKQAIDLGIAGAVNSLAWFYFETIQQDKKTEALSLAHSAVADDPCFAYLHTLATIALWTNQIDIARESIEKILLSENWQQDINKKEFIDLLILLLAKGQTNLFDKWQQQFDLADRLKPLYYAFLNLVPKKYPDQLLRMGSELKETVEEILEKIAAYKEKY